MTTGRAGVCVRRSVGTDDLFFVVQRVARLRRDLFVSRASASRRLNSNSDGESNPWQETERDFSDQRLNVGDAMLLAFDLHKNSTLVELK